MGNPKHKWSAEEEAALRKGIEKHGVGKWKLIIRDPEFNVILQSRNNIDLKDKWRNISPAGGQGSREKSRTPKVPSNHEAPMINSQTCPPPVPVEHDLPAADHPVKNEPSKEPPADTKNGPMYNDMVFEALLTTQEPNGLDFNSLACFIEQRVNVPQNFRKQFSSRLRRLVAQNKLEKIGNRFCQKLETITEEEAQCVADIEMMLEEMRDEEEEEEGESLEAAAAEAAKCSAEAEHLSWQAAEAVRQVERIHYMAQEAAQLVQLANEIFDRCSLGEVVKLA